MTVLPLRRLATHLVRHPQDAFVLARSLWLLRRDRWYARRPFLPLPDDRYWRFRMETAFGSTDAHIPVAAVVDAARWAARQPVGR